MKHIKTYEGLFSKPDDNIVKELIQAVKQNKYTNLVNYNKSETYSTIYFLTFEIGDSKIEIEHFINDISVSDHFYLKINSKSLETSQRLIKKLYNVFIKIDKEKEREEIEKEKEKLKYNLTPEAEEARKFNF